MPSSRSSRYRGLAAALAAALAFSCMKAGAPPVVPAPAAGPPAPDDLALLLADAEASLAAGEPARGAVLFARYLAAASGAPEARQAYAGLARAYEAMGDYAAAVRVRGIHLERFPRGPDVAANYAAMGACQAELGLWSQSADSYRRVRTLADLSATLRIEALAREGYALFMLDRFDEADPVLAEADRVLGQAEGQGTERLGTFYFVGMARFYRAAILHRRFRELPIRLPERIMRQDYANKLELLVAAQKAYEHAIKAKHLFWVSAAGYQLGSLIGEFYDALTHAPVPTWVKGGLRRSYYDELRKQLLPLVHDAVWVCEKTLQTAARLGYESRFVDETERRLARLQAFLLAGGTPGEPPPRLVPEAVSEPEPPGHGEAPAPIAGADRKLFVPEPTPL